MNIPVRIGMDTSKSVFQLHGVDENEAVVVRRRFRRAEMIRYFERLPPVLVAIESCGSSHHWGRLLQSFGHEVKLIPPQYVKAYVKRGKNDAADAEALCEAVTRPSMRFVPVKSKERQAACMLMTVRERLVSVKSQLSNAFRSDPSQSGISSLAPLSWMILCRQYRSAGLHILSGTSREKLALEARRNADRWRLPRYASRLAGRPLLLVTADDGFAAASDMLANAVMAIDGRRLARAHFATDHSYSDCRIALQSQLLLWLGATVGLPRPRHSGRM